MGTVQKFSSQADSALLERLREIAEREGRQFQAVLADALRDYVERRERIQPRPTVKAAFETSLRQYDALYRELAK
jgi:predicted transcriptional regulator